MSVADWFEEASEVQRADERLGFDEEDSEFVDQCLVVVREPGTQAETLSGRTRERAGDRTHAKKSSISAAGLAALVASSSQPGQSMSNTTTGRGRPKTLSMVPLAWR